jgi:hypothetical protein
LPVTVSVVPVTEIDLAPLANVSCTEDAVAEAGWPGPITRVTDVALIQAVDEAAVPELGVGPTLAVIAVKRVLMKLLPVTLTVPPTYANAGDMDEAVGSGVTVSVLLGTV